MKYRIKTRNGFVVQTFDSLAALLKWMARHEAKNPGHYSLPLEIERVDNTPRTIGV
jgi:hypothetical protein